LSDEDDDEQRQKNLAALAWATSGPFGPIIPAVIYLRYGKESRFVAQHSLQAALSYVFLFAAAIVFGLVLGGITGVHFAMHGVPEANATAPASVTVATTIGAVLLSLIYLALVVVSFVHAARARRGQWPRYPFVERLAITINPPKDD
jgi:uncharacterized membrane protein